MNKHKIKIVPEEEFEALKIKERKKALERARRIREADEENIKGNNRWYRETLNEVWDDLHNKKTQMSPIQKINISLRSIAIAYITHLMFENNREDEWFGEGMEEVSEERDRIANKEWEEENDE